jgi:hypothetical protein
MGHVGGALRYACCLHPEGFVDSQNRVGCRRCDHIPENVYQASGDDRILFVPAYVLSPGEVCKNPAIRVVSPSMDKGLSAVPYRSRLEHRARREPAFWNSLPETLQRDMKARANARMKVRKDWDAAVSAVPVYTFEPFVDPPEASKKLSAEEERNVAAKKAATDRLVEMLVRPASDELAWLRAVPSDLLSREMAFELRTHSLQWLAVQLVDYYS